MNLFEDLLPSLRGLPEARFTQQFSSHYLLRQCTEEERRIGPSRAVGLTVMPGQLAPNAGQNITEALAELDAEAEILSRFHVYKIHKSGRNIFAGGITLGRAQNNDVVVPLSSVSKFHAWLKDERGSLLVFDARSRFGTFVGGVRAASEGDKGIPLPLGTELRLGEVSLTLLDAPGLHRWCERQFRLIRGAGVNRG